MAMIDYGTILVRDGIIQNRDKMFMEETDLGCDIWEQVDSGDEINYKKRAVGKPYDIKIAE